MKFNKHERFSIRKFKVGAASVLLGTFGVALASNAVDVLNINVVKVAKASDSAIISGSADEAKKQQVISDLLAKLEAKWKEIEVSKNNLTSEEYNDAITFRDKTKSTMVDVINKAENMSKVDELKNTYVYVIDDFKSLYVKELKKPSAKKEITDIYNAKKVELKDNQELLNKLESLKASALSDIQTAKSNADVDREKTKYLSEINSLKVLTPEEKQLEEAKKEKIAELINTVELKWQEVEKKRKQYTPSDYERVELKKEELLARIRDNIGKSSNFQELNTQYNYLHTPVAEFDQYILPKVKPEAIKGIEEAYKAKKGTIESSTYLKERLDSLRTEAENNINKAELDYDVAELKEKYITRINSLELGNESAEMLEEAKDKEIEKLLLKLEEKWKEIEKKSILRTLKEDEEAVNVMSQLRTNIKEKLKEAKDNKLLEELVSNYTGAILTLDVTIGEPKVKPKAIEELISIYDSKKLELKKDFISLPELEKIKKEAIEEIERALYEDNVNTLKNKYKEKLSKIELSEQYKSLEIIIKAASDKSSIVFNSVSITEKNKKEVETKVLSILDEYTEKIKSGNHKETLEELVKKAKSDINNLKLIFDLETLSNKFDKKVGDPKKLDASFDVVETFLNQLDRDLKAIYSTTDGNFGDASEFLYLNVLKVDDKKNNALTKLLENSMYEGVSKSISDAINSNLKNGVNSNAIKLLLDSLKKENKKYISILEEKHNGFGITKYEAPKEKLGEIINLLEKNVDTWKSLIPKLDNLNEKVKENKNITEEEAKRILGLIKDEPKNPEVSQPEETAPIKPEPEKTPTPEKEIPKKPEMAPVPPKVGTPESGDNKKPEVSKPGETVPSKPEPEKTPVPEKEIPKKPEMAPVPPKMETPELGDNKQPEVLQPDVNKPEETVPSKPTPEVTPKAPEKETPKPGKPSGETKPKENTPNKPEASNPEVSHPDVNKPEETVPSKPTPEVTPKAPEKEMPKPDKPSEETKPKENTPSKPEASNPEVSQPDVNKPEETVPSKPTPEVSPKVPEKEEPKPGKPSGEPKPKENTPDKPKASQPDVNKPEETVPNKPTPETTPVPEKEMPKPEKPEASTPEASQPEKDNSKDSNPETSKPEETVPSKPAPEVTPKAPEKATPKEPEMGQPKPEKPSGETKPKENTPNKPESSNPEVSQPDVNKPGEIKPKQPTPEVMPKSPEKETPKEPEIGQPKPGKPEVSQPEMDKAKNEKPKGEGPKGEQLSPKEQGSTSTKQELTKQVGDSVVTVIIEDSRKLDLQAKDVTAENKEFIQSKLNDKSATIKVFDLELLDFNNKSIIKLDKERTVKIVVTENIANKEVSVYYVDKATGQLVKVPAIVNGNTIVFNTNHFSSYGLVISDKEKSKTTSTTKTSNKTLPNTGETTNNMLGILGIAATVVIATRRKRLKK